jgi:hypothetical protein
MSFPSRFELDDQITLAPPIGTRRAEAPREPIRLLKFLAYLAIGGSERQVLNIRHGIDASRFDLHLGCFGCFDEQIAVDLSGTPLEIYKIRKLYGVRAIRECLRLASYMRQNHIDIVHAYNYPAPAGGHQSGLPPGRSRSGQRRSP